MLLAQNAVHGVMAGYVSSFVISNWLFLLPYNLCDDATATHSYTAFSTGLVNNRVVYIPMPRLVATSPRVMDPRGRFTPALLLLTTNIDLPMIR